MTGSAELFNNNNEHSLTTAYQRAMRSGDERELREGVRALLRHHKARGTPPERMLVELKSLLPRLYPVTPGDLKPTERTVHEQLISWAITAYFDGSLFD